MHMLSQAEPGQLAAVLGSCVRQLLAQGSHLQTLLSIADHVAAAAANSSGTSPQEQVSSYLLDALREAVQPAEPQPDSSHQPNTGLAAAVVGCLEAPGLAADRAAFLAGLRSSAWAVLEAAAAADAEPDSRLLALMAQVSSGTMQSRSAAAWLHPLAH